MERTAVSRWTIYRTPNFDRISRKRSSCCCAYSRGHLALWLRTTGTNRYCTLHESILTIKSSFYRNGDCGCRFGLYYRSSSDLVNESHIELWIRQPLLQSRLTRICSACHLSRGSNTTPFDATHWLNRSAGVSMSSAFLARSFICLATALSVACECTERSPFGKYFLSRPFVFSLDPRCQGLCGS